MQLQCACIIKLRLPTIPACGVGAQPLWQGNRANGPEPQVYRGGLRPVKARPARGCDATIASNQPNKPPRRFHEFTPSIAQQKGVYLANKEEDFPCRLSTPSSRSSPASPSATSP